MKKYNFIAVIVLIVVTACVLSFIGFDKSAESSAVAQNTTVQTTQFEAVKMLDNSLKLSSNDAQSNYSQALYLCALSELTKNPESISDGWDVLQAHLKEHSDESLESQLEMISDFQRATLEALLSSSSQATFDKVWIVNNNQDNGIIKFRDEIIISQLDPILNSLKTFSEKIKNNPVNPQEETSLDVTRESSYLDQSTEEAIVDFENVLTIIADIADRSNNLKEKINESNNYRKNIANNIYVKLKGKYDQLNERLTKEQSRETSELGNNTFMPEYDEKADKWKDGPYYILSKDIQAFQDVVRNPVIARLLSLIEDEEDEKDNLIVDRVDMSSTEEARINIPVALEEMQENIRQLIQIRYNLYANAILARCNRNAIDKPTGIADLKRLSRLDSGLLFPVVNNEISSLIQEVLKSDNPIPGESRKKIIQNTFLGEKIPLTAF